MNREHPQLQLAIDVLSTADALAVAEKVYPHFDIAEIGTPLIIEEGVAALEKVKSRFPEKRYLADLKIMDAGFIEASSAFRRGADLVTVLGAADDRTISQALEAVAKYGGRIMADLINVPDPLVRARRLEQLGVPVLCVHTAFDRQAPGVDPMSELSLVRPVVRCELAVAGGLKLENVGRAVAGGGDIVVVGGAIINHTDPGCAAAEIMARIREARRE